MPRRPSDASQAERTYSGLPSTARAPSRGDDAELRGEHDLVAVAGDGLADELLVGAEAVHVGGVEERDAELAGPSERGDGLVAVDGAVGEAHPHAAEPLSGDGERAEGAGGQGHRSPP